MQKPTILIFSGRDELAARRLALQLRDGTNLVLIRSASPHMVDGETNDKVLIMDDVDKSSRQSIHRLFPLAQDVQIPSEKIPQPQEPPPAVQGPPRSKKIRQRRGRAA